MMKKERYKIAYITSVDPSDATKFSGVYFFQKKAMQKNIGDIETIGPVHASSIGLLRKFLKKLFKNSPKKYNLSHSLLISKIYGCIFSRKIKNGKYDLIFGDKASTEMAYIKTHTPIIYSTDTTFSAIHDYYAAFTNLNRLSIFEGNMIEQTVLARASAVICASKWAADNVLEEYKINPQKVFILLRGANLDTIPERQQALTIRNNICKLLFVGKNNKI